MEANRDADYRGSRGGQTGRRSPRITRDRDESGRERSSAATRVPSADQRDPRPVYPLHRAIRETVPLLVNTSVRCCSVRNRLAISIQPVGQRNSTGARKCAVQPLARMRIGPVDSWHRLLRRLVETFEKRLVSNRASGKTRQSRANLSLQVQELLTFAARQYWRRRPAAFAASHRWCNSRILG